MIKLLAHGNYNLTETRHLTKILELSEIGIYAWINAGEIGEILVLSGEYPKLYTLASGNFRLYEVKDEPDYIDTLHLELFTGKNSWQGYLLPTGLPNKTHIRSRILPTEELITKSRSNPKPEAALLQA
jgi:hypothetical protein